MATTTRTALVLLTLATGLALPACNDGRSSRAGAFASTAAAVASPSATTSGGTSAPTTPAPVASSTTAPPSTQATGTIRALSYNVAGLPQGISSSSPVTNTPQISPKLNGYDLVLAQEDFCYHAELARMALHAFQSPPQSSFATFVNDGLNRFSVFPFVDHTRVKWAVMHGVFSHGNDALSSKGFTAARHEVAPGVVIDVYNLHADAGGDAGDVDARSKQFEQLARFMATYSAGRAVIVAGDTNLHGNDPEDEPVLQAFMASAGLQDVARTLGKPESIDRIFFRSSADVTLTPLGWRIASEFVDAAGRPLSDHEAIHVDLEWRKIR